MKYFHLPHSNQMNKDRNTSSSLHLEQGKKGVNRLPGYTLNEYLIILNPHEELRQKIEKSRKELVDNYLIQQPRTGRPNISLVRFSATSMQEEKLMQRLRLIAIEEKPFLVELKDYGSYPMHAIFIRIANQPRVVQLIRNLKQLRQLMKAAGDDPHFLLDPQIALAGRISKEKYLDAMKEYLNKKFTGRFLADSFLLLKRAKSDKNYQVVNRFIFEYIPLTAAQGELFS